MNSAMSAGVFVTIALMGPAHAAATSTCPPIQDIKQTAMANGGYRYETSQPDGLTWTGENPQAAVSDLTDSTFHDARYDMNSKAVICTYKGPMNNDASVSVTAPVVDWNLTPTRGEWRGTYCEALDRSRCEFTHH